MPRKLLNDHEQKNQMVNDYNKMVKEIREYLMGVCEREINFRWNVWSEIINNGIDKINEKLFGESDDNDDEKKCIPPNFDRKLSKQDIETITEFINQWNGLKVDVSKRPKHYEAFRTKAQSWMNGRRATQYGRHLYPVMLNKAHRFVRELAGDYFMIKIQRLEGYNNIIHNVGKINGLKELYTKTLMSSFIVGLCETEISLNRRAKRVYLLCPNSFKSKRSKTRIALRNLADKSDENDEKLCEQMRCYEQFPDHRRAATDYFENKHKATLKQLKQELDNMGDCDMTDYNPGDNIDDTSIDCIVIDSDESDDPVIQSPIHSVQDIPNVPNENGRNKLDFDFDKASRELHEWMNAIRQTQYEKDGETIVTIPVEIFELILLWKEEKEQTQQKINELRDSIKRMEQLQSYDDQSVSQVPFQFESPETSPSQSVPSNQLQFIQEPAKPPFPPQSELSYTQSMQCPPNTIIPMSRMETDNTTDSINISQVPLMTPAPPIQAFPMFNNYFYANNPNNSSVDMMGLPQSVPPPSIYYCP